MTQQQTSATDTPAPVYEHYLQEARVTQWKAGCVYRTESRGTGWFSDATIAANIPRETGVLYIAASDEYARTHMTIRRAGEG